MSKFDLAKAQAELFEYRLKEEEPKLPGGIHPGTWKQIQQDAAMAEKIRRGGVDLAKENAKLWGYDQ